MEASEGNLPVGVSGWAPHWGAHLRAPLQLKGTLTSSPDPACSWILAQGLVLPRAPLTNLQVRPCPPAVDSRLGPRTLPQTDHPAKGLGLGLPSSFPSDRFTPQPAPMQPQDRPHGHSPGAAAPLRHPRRVRSLVPSFELYMVLCFSVAAAVAGYTFSNVTLCEYLGHKAMGSARPHSHSAWGPSQLRAPNVMALTHPKLDRDHSP